MICLYRDIDEKEIVRLATEGKNVNEISKTLNYSKHVVVYRLNKLGISLDYYKSPFQKNFSSGEALTEIEKANIESMAIGDGCLEKTGKDSARLKIAHSIKQKDYLLWKYSLISKCVSKYPYESDVKLNDKVYGTIRFSTASLPDIKKSYDIFYPNNKKILPESIVSNITKLRLLIWFLDDGSAGIDNSRGNRRVSQWVISSESFTEEENEMAKFYLLKNLNINAHIKKMSRNGKGFTNLGFSKSSGLYETLIDITPPYMTYKLTGVKAITSEA